MEWVLIIATLTVFSEPKVQAVQNISQEQCMQMRDQIMMNVPKVSAGCFGPNGEVAP